MPPSPPAIWIASTRPRRGQGASDARSDPRHPVSLSLAGPDVRAARRCLTFPLDGPRADRNRTCGSRAPVAR
jgi:hypothetical protein